jgi:hypothetical protein
LKDFDDAYPPLKRRAIFEGSFGTERPFNNWDAPDGTILFSLPTIC